MCVSTSGKDVANNSMILVNLLRTDQYDSVRGGLNYDTVVISARVFVA